ncbi:endosomal/lysosomal proton channel TMEM175 isoform X3 [Nycticebus coucang]|uniref:endosomal/lysosomal proton channel TMEM175 isoform X3 n=1 Tax=Nycticebus coucang TaxID=9470 RepID=UPI00234C1CE7|nr:endosomal/lysosomal proton channel TMEM175 isoform X3 [Nycticebus coucang]
MYPPEVTMEPEPSPGSHKRFDKSIETLLATKIAVYLMTFLIVTAAWAAHTRLFQLIGNIDDTLALLNLVCMMTITLLPYTVSCTPGILKVSWQHSDAGPGPRVAKERRARHETGGTTSPGTLITFGWFSWTQFSLMVTFPDVPLGIFLFCTCVIAIGAVQVGCPGPLPCSWGAGSTGAPQPLLCDCRWEGGLWDPHRQPRIHGFPLLSILCGYPPERALHCSPQALIVVYAFHSPHLLSPQILQSAHRALCWRHILLVILRGPTLCFAAAIFSLFFFPVSYLLMAMIIFLPYISKAASWCRERLVGHEEPPAPPVEFTFDLYESLSKERMEAFSDGVYAIVATLLILDICEDNVPDPKDVREKFHGSLVAALGVYGPRFLAYFGSFATVGLLWSTHHSLFLHVRTATRAMGLLNTLSLAFVGGLPLAYQQTSTFAQQPHDELERVRLSCAIIFFASIFQFAIWATALLHEIKTLQPLVRFGGREHALLFAKLALYPCASLLTFVATFFLSRLSTAIFHLMQIAVPPTFLLLSLLLRLGQAGLRGLVRPLQPWPGTTGEADPQSQLLPTP